MTAFNPISPRQALDMIAAAALGDEPPLVIADYAEAGVVKGYARLIETITADGVRREVRDSRISRELWRRVVDEQKAGGIATSGTVRLEGAELRGGVPRVNLIGIRFDKSSIVALVEQHGSEQDAATPSAGRIDSLVAAPKPAIASDTAIAAQAPVAAVTQPIVRFEEGVPAYSIIETAQILGVCRATVNNMIRRGRLVTSKVGRRTLVGSESIRAQLPS